MSNGKGIIRVNGESTLKKIHSWEPCFFILFGLFHLHRIWALFDRTAYAAFWMGILNSKGAAYFLIMGVLAALCVLGIITFFKNRKHNYWWRWVYMFGGSYVLFDLLAIATGLKQWSRLLQMMFDTASPYWNAVWSFFIILGGLSFSLGVYLLFNRKQEKSGSPM